MVISLKKIREIEWLPLITALLLMCNLRPYYVWGVYSNPIMQYLTIVLCCIPFFLKRRQLSKKDNSVVFIFALTILTYLFVGFIHGLTIFGLTARFLTTVSIVILFSQKEFIDKVFNYFFSIYAILIALAIVSWVLFLIGYNTEIDIINSSLEAERQFRHFPFLVVESLSADMVRFGGPFDEPGVVGTISALILCIKNYNVKDFRTFVTLISGIISFSMFFYLLTVIFVVIRFIVTKKNLGIIIILALGFFYLYNATKEDPIINEWVWGRLSLSSSDGASERMLRTTIEGRNFYESKIGTSEWFWGLDDPSHYLKISEGSSSYMNVIMMNGAIFFFMYIACLLVYISRKLSLGRFAIAVIIIIANIYQRPDIFGVVILFLYTGLGNSMAKPSYFSPKKTVVYKH